MVSLLVFVALVAVAAFTGAQFEPGVWYAELAKPSWTPHWVAFATALNVSIWRLNPAAM